MITFIGLYASVTDDNDDTFPALVLIRSGAPQMLTLENGELSQTTRLINKEMWSVTWTSHPLMEYRPLIDAALADGSITYDTPLHELNPYVLAKDKERDLRI